MLRLSLRKGWEEHTHTHTHTHLPAVDSLIDGTRTKQAVNGHIASLPNAEGTVLV